MATVDLHDAKKQVDLDELERLKKEEEEKAKRKAEKPPVKNEEDEEEEEELEDEEEEEEEESSEEDEEEQEEEEETEEEKAAREAKEKEEADKKKKQVDYEKKFKESSKEALILKKRLDDLEAEKNKKVEITEEYLKSKYPDWDDMTTGEQRAIRLAEESKQELAEIKNKTNEFNNDRKWSEKVDKFVEEDLPDAFPKIKGREEEFKRFATRPTRKGLPLDDLAKIFLFENPEVIKKKRSLFSPPGGVNKQPKKQAGMTAEEIANLRKTNTIKYMKLVKEGKIKIDL